jgi:hypothetical protein
MPAPDESPPGGRTPAVESSDRPAGRPVSGWRAELLVGVAMVAISSLFVGLRLANHDFDATVFILAGEEVTDPAVNPDMFIVEGAFGYDGQRYYRLSRNPFTSEVEEFGITFDRPRLLAEADRLPVHRLVGVRVRPRRGGPVDDDRRERGRRRRDRDGGGTLGPHARAVTVARTHPCRLGWLCGGHLPEPHRSGGRSVPHRVAFGSPPTTLGPGRRGTGGSGSHPGNIAHLLGRAPSHVVLSARAASRCCQG